MLDSYSGTAHRHLSIHSSRLEKYTEHTSSAVPLDKNYIAHNAAYESVGLKAVYLAYMTENFALFLEAARHHQFAGFSVTMPFKVCVYHHQHMELRNTLPEVPWWERQQMNPHDCAVLNSLLHVLAGASAGSRG
jgi:Shikimate dehydrogenase substrate binding domain